MQLDPLFTSPGEEIVSRGRKQRCYILWVGRSYLLFYKSPMRRSAPRRMKIGYFQGRIT
ncbi:hypothetical protein [Candidatus Hakubella thermalkaliphila]|uniref:hypothetical protein n=1 Tax=Candidatus Hakubella thermalkaliphila TaxID=2754717 RepID=UPI001593C745|nr:hypothetical protein [Candidatus Hakubella thermalkaliphila]